MKSFTLILTAWLPLVAVHAFPIMVSPTTTTTTAGSSTTTCLFSATRGRPSSRSASSRPNGDGRDDAGGVGPRRVGRSRRSGGPGPTGGGDSGGIVNDNDDMSGPRRRPPRRRTEVSNNGSSTMPGIGPNYSSSPNSMDGRSMNAQRSGRGGGSSGGSPYIRGSRNGADFDYSGGNLRFGTGKYQQRVNDGYTGGVNLSSNGRSMQHDIYRSGRDVGRRYYDELYDDYDMMMMMDDNDMMLDDDRMMYDDYDMMMGDDDYYDDLYYRRSPGRGGGVFRDDYYQQAGRGGPRAYSNSRNGGYTTNGRSHQYNSRMDELRRYQDGFYYGDDSYFAEKGGYGDLPPPRRGSYGGGRAGLLRDMFD